MAKLLEAQIHEETKLWSLIVLCLSRSKYARKEQWRRGKQSKENRGQQLQSSFALLEHFPKSIFYILYTISNIRKSKIQASNHVRFGAEIRKIWPSQTTSEVVFPEDERLTFWFLGVKEARVGSLPSTYLGLPLSAPLKSVTVWDGVEERFRRRLAM
ncbi:hypothetical protein CK203_111692 [Vitis vinifera]|uniref:Uncharacterized protein n=1 Tax=Vitis vinifera TaxID=29760 RepID=A0A438FCM1_VITVI|nr:hypothetical protein CK203_111692 [Vitis vinifera]